MSSASAAWVPLRWPETWRDPVLLELLRGTPVNCVVGPPEEIAGPARAAGVAVAGAEVAWTTRAKASWNGPAPVLALTDAVWPGVPVSRGRDAAEASPTGVPWVDANGWLVQLCRLLAPAKTIWLAHQPPENSTVFASAYQVAVADAAAYGARWVASLDKKLAAALAAREGQALETWKTIASALRFFETHHDWSRRAPLAAVGVLSDFSGPNADMAAEILNLLARRSVPYRVLDKAAVFDGLKAIVYPDAEPPGKELASRLLAFVSAGGLLIAGPRFPAPAGQPEGSDAYRRYNLRRVGQGRIALAREEQQDPYLVAADAQLILGRRFDLLRLFNSGTLNCYYTGDNRTALLQVINYARRMFSSPVSVAFSRPYQSARLWQLAAGEPTPLPVLPAESGVEIHLPQFGAYSAVELE